MKGCSNRFWLNCLVILAFIAAGVSPACKFISGQSQLVEICGVDGVKMVRLAAEELPPESEHHDKASSECAFCIASAHIKTVSAKPATITLPAMAFVSVERQSEVSQAYAALRSQILPRGPPAAV